MASGPDTRFNPKTGMKLFKINIRKATAGGMHYAINQPYQVLIFQSRNEITLVKLCCLCRNTMCTAAGVGGGGRAPGSRFWGMSPRNHDF